MFRLLIFIFLIFFSFLETTSFGQQPRLNALLNSNSFIHTQDKMQEYIVFGCKVKDIRQGKLYSVTPIDEIMPRISHSQIIQNLWFIEMTCLNSKKCVYYLKTGKERDNAFGFTNKESRDKAFNALFDLYKKCRKF